MTPSPFGWTADRSEMLSAVERGKDKHIAKCLLRHLAAGPDIFMSHRNADSPDVFLNSQFAS